MFQNIQAFLFAILDIKMKWIRLFRICFAQQIKIMFIMKPKIVIENKEN